MAASKQAIAINYFNYYELTITMMKTTIYVDDDDDDDATKINVPS